LVATKVEDPQRSVHFGNGTTGGGTTTTSSLEEGGGTRSTPSTPTNNVTPTSLRIPTEFSLSAAVQKRLQQKQRRDVVYDTENHFSVMFQIYGSVWPKVLPWCFAVVAVTYLFIWLRDEKQFDITIKDSTGHNFMSILVSFLVVTRVTITYSRFMEARQLLQDLFLACREVVQYTCVLTNQNTSLAAQQWRQDVAYRVILCLRLAMAAVEHKSIGLSAWDCIPDQDQKDLLLMVDPTSDEAKNYRTTVEEYEILRALQHGPRTTTDETFRAPVVFVYALREALLQPRQDTHILAQRDWHVNESLKLLQLTSSFLTAFHGLKKLVVTPFPFPLIQLNRIFLFAWCFSLPLVLIHENDELVETLVLVFFSTFGFLGLEYATIEMDDPFGDDPNDFPATRWAEAVFEDVYITIYKTDGYKSAIELRMRITERIARRSTVMAPPSSSSPSS
jgi:predicted membrane chloride channel (bestrophin family)